MPDDKERPKRPPSSPIVRKLLKARSVLLFGPIEPKLTQQVIKELVVLNEISRQKPIRMYVNSPGGWADDGFAIYDVMRFVDAPVHAICTGLAASAATIVMMGANEGHRYTLPNSRWMLHQPSSGARGTASDIAITAKEIIRLREKANDLFVQATKQPLDRIQTDMQRDYWLNAQESVDYGLVDKIVTRESDLP